MNCGIILLFLLLFGQNGCGCGKAAECGCDRPAPAPCRPKEPECDRGCEPERDKCPCGGDSRFEPRFEARPFPDTGCGCNDK